MLDDPSGSYWAALLGVWAGLTPGVGPADQGQEHDQELHQPALPPEDPAAGTHVRPTTTAMKAYRAGLKRDRCMMGFTC